MCEVALLFKNSSSLFWNGKDLIDWNVGGQSYFIWNNSNSKCTAPYVTGKSQAVLLGVFESSCLYLRKIILYKTNVSNLKWTASWAILPGVLENNCSSFWTGNQYEMFWATQLFCAKIQSFEMACPFYSRDRHELHLTQKNIFVWLRFKKSVQWVKLYS